MHATYSWKLDILKENMKKLTRFFPLLPVPFYGQDYKNKKCFEPTKILFWQRTYALHAINLALESYSIALRVFSVKNFI